MLPADRDGSMPVRRTDRTVPRKYTDSRPPRTAPVLELYQAEACPHSAAVRETLTELGLSYVVHNPRRIGDDPETLNAQTQAELEAVGGADQIPFLVDHTRGETLYESDRIEQYLREHYGGG
jgi:glutathione S-transferase